MRNWWLLSSILFISYLNNLEAQTTKWISKISDSNVFWCNNIIKLNENLISYNATIDYNNSQNRSLRYAVHNLSNGKIVKWDNFNFNISNGAVSASFNCLFLNKNKNKFYSLVDNIVIPNVQKRQFFSVADTNFQTINTYMLGDSFSYDIAGQVYELEPNKIAIAYQSNDNWYNPVLYNWRRFGLYFVDTLGNVLFKDTFPSAHYERFVNMDVDTNNNMFMAGYDQFDYVGIESKRQMVLKKINSNGQLIKNKFLTYRPNAFYGFVNILTPNVQPQLLYIMSHITETDDHYANEFRLCIIRLTWLDTNLNITRVDSIYTNKNHQIFGTKVMRNGDILCYGQGDLDTSSWRLNKQQYEWCGWACRLSPTGVKKWERSYSVRDSTEHYITTAEEDDDQSIYLGGCVMPNSTEKQAALIMKLDSNGCINDTFCDPLGVHEIKYLPPTQLLLYPNPASQYITLQIPNTQYLGGQAIIYGIDGKIVNTIPNVQASQTIPINHLAPDNYWLHYMVGEWRGYVQFVVQ